MLVDITHDLFDPSVRKRRVGIVILRACDMEKQVTEATCEKMRFPFGIFRKHDGKLTFYAWAKAFARAEDHWLIKRKLRDHFVCEKATQKAF